MLATSALSKSLGMIQVVALGFLLTDKDYGLYGMALGVFGITQALREGGMRAILIRHSKRFDELVSPGFWLGMSLNLVAIAIILGAGKGVAVANEEPALMPVIAVLAATLLISPIEVVSNSKLSIDLRFKRLAAVSLWSNMLRIVVVIAAAAAGLGALSFAVAIMAGLLFRAILLTRYAAVTPWAGSVNFAIWPWLLRQAAWLMVGAAALGLQRQGDYLAASFFLSTAVLGLYVFAFQLVEQFDSMIAANVQNVLLPALSKLIDEKDRLAAAYERAVSLLVFVTAPATLCLALVADPLVRLVWADRWVEAIPVLQVLSVFFFGKVLFSVPYALLQGTGRFRFWACCCAIIGVSAASAAGLGAWQFGTAQAVAICVGCTLLLSGAVAVQLAHPAPTGRRVWLAWRILSPWLASVLIAGALFIAGQEIAWADGRGARALEVVVLTLCFGAAFGAFSLVAFRSQVAEVIRMSPGRFRPVLSRIVARVGISV